MRLRILSCIECPRPSEIVKRMCRSIEIDGTGITHRLICADDIVSSIRYEGIWFLCLIQRIVSFLSRSIRLSSSLIRSSWIPRVLLGWIYRRRWWREVWTCWYSGIWILWIKVWHGHILSSLELLWNLEGLLLLLLLQWLILLIGE